MLASSDRILSPHNSPPSTMSPNLDHRLQMPLNAKIVIHIFCWK